MSTVVNDLRSIDRRVIIDNGTDTLDVSAAFESLDLSTEVWNDRAWFAPRGTLRLAAYCEGFAESFDCRINPARWAPGNLVKVSLWFGSWVLLPWRLKILRYPNRPYPGNRYIDLEVGTDADLLNYRAPEGDPTGVEYGTSTSAAFLINGALSQAGAPALVDGIASLSLPFSPEKQSGGSWVTYAGHVAYAAGHVLWQQGDGAVRATPLATENLTPFVHYVVGRDEADYVPETAQESPPEKVRVTGTTYEIVDDRPENIDRTENVNGVITRFQVVYQNWDTANPRIIETTSIPLELMRLGTFVGNTILFPYIRKTTVFSYDSVGRLIEQQVTTERPSFLVPFLPRTTSLVTIGVSTTSFVFAPPSTSPVGPMRSRTAIDRGLNVIGPTAVLETRSTTIEEWDQRSVGKFIYTKRTINAGLTGGSLPARNQPSTDAEPPAATFRPASKQRTEKQFLAQATFTSQAGNGFAEKLWAITLPSGMGVSTAQCAAHALRWGRIRQGRQFAVQWAADLSQDWLTDFNPVRRIDFTVDGRRTAYLVEALNLVVDKRSAAIGGRGVELGLVSEGAIIPPFTVEVP